MKRLILSTAISAISAIAAQAADVPVNKAQSTASIPASWAGWYGGGYVGAQQGKSNTGVDGWTDTQRNPVQRCYTREQEEGPPIEKCYDKRHEFVTSSTTYPPASSNGNVIGITGGLYGGYNWQQGRTILGIEADGGWSGARDYVQIYAVNATHKMPWNFNLTVRAGYLVTPNTLLYGKGGLAVLSQRSEITGPTGTASADQTKAGWTAGGGIEQANFILGARARVELMYAKVSDQTVAIPGASSTLNGGSWKGIVGLAWSLN